MSINGVKDACVLEVNGDNAAAASRIEGRLDSLDDGVRRAAGGQVAGFGVLVGFELPPGVMQRLDEKALRVVHLDLAAAQGNGKTAGELVEGGLIVTVHR